MQTVLIQPELPHYRLHFFESLAGSLNGDLRILSGDISDEHGLLDIALHPIWKLKGLPLFWQAGLGLPEHFGPGDVLVLSGNPRYVSNYPIWLRAKKLGGAVVWWGHGWSAGSHGMQSWLRRQIMRLADVVLLYTDKEREEFCKMGFSSDRIFATNNTIDTEAVRRAESFWPPNRLKAFQEHNGIQGKSLLLYCGRLTAKAELESCIEAMPRILQLAPRTELVVVGDGEQLHRLRLKAENLAVSGRIRWLGSIREETELAPWFMSALAFVYPGAIGLSLQHAFAYGLPVVTHDDEEKHMPEFAALTPGQNGLTFRRGHPECLAATIVDVISDSEMRSRLSLRAKGTIESEYNVENMVSRFVTAVKRASHLGLATRGGGHQESRGA